MLFRALLIRIHINFIQSLQIIRYLVISNPCDVELQSAICFTMRFPATTCMIAFAALQVAMVIERAIAIWNSAHYHSWSSRIGFTFISASVPFFKNFEVNCGL
ncbi:hypothetical protein COOONC_24155 [Cooperia oncophora]